MLKGHNERLPERLWNIDWIFKISFGVCLVSILNDFSDLNG